MSRAHPEILEIFKTLYDFYGPQAWWPADTKFEMIVGAILTQNTAWTNVEKALANLKKARALSSLSAFRKISEKQLARLIKPAGYYNVKAKRLRNFLTFLWNSYNGKLEKLARRQTHELRAELLAVNGIGPETCDSILLYAFNRPVFVIDAYTKRIFSRHRFFKEGTNYREAQEFFMRNLPVNCRLFNEYHALIVRLAKDFCRNLPDCANCPLNKDKIACN